MFKIHRPNKWDSLARNSYKKENHYYTQINDESYVEELLSDLSIKYTNYTQTTKNNRFPRISSFWHNTEDILPEIVIASIKSFLNVGYEYNLYTYKEFKNIPDGCIIKDANDIIPFDEFFLGIRNYYASFADYFRIMLANKVDTARTDTDNFYFSDDFEGSGSVFIIQNNRIQNSFFYIANDDESIRFKKLLLGCYKNLGKFLKTDSFELLKEKFKLLKYKTKKEKLKNAKRGFGGSCPFTSAFKCVNLKDCAFEYEKYFNGFHYTHQYKLFVLLKRPYMDYYNKNVKILIMSMALLDREPRIKQNFNPNSYVAELLNK